MLKHILITGVNSYIGNRFADWVSQWPDRYLVTKISLKTDAWETMDWSQYDVLLHVAGIAHNSSNSKMEELYYQVNRDLTLRVAEKGKAEGIHQFIYMSSIIVFGTKVTSIGVNTSPNPDNFYGDSKLEGERGIYILNDEQFNVAIIRPPMVYGEGSKGNYPKLAKLATITPFFPKYRNERSMIHIDNLTEFIRVTIDDQATGYYHPQNTEYVCTSDLVQTISEIKDKNIYMIRIPSRIMLLLCKLGIIKKIFGDYKYDTELSKYKREYIVNDFRESITRTERGGFFEK